MTILGKSPITVQEPGDASDLYGLIDYALVGTVQVQVQGQGSYGLRGQSPGLAGKTIIFTKWATTDQLRLTTLVHELTHAFGLLHKCGNWDYKSPHTLATGAKDTRKSCVMNYADEFILDENKEPEPWTHNQQGSSLCAEHIDAIRKSNLESLSGLGW